MDKLSEVYRQIDQLNHEELAQLQTYVDQRLDQLHSAAENPQAKIAALMASVENFWGDMPQAEIDAIVEDMNSEYIPPLTEDETIDELEAH